MCHKLWVLALRDTIVVILVNVEGDQSVKRSWIFVEAWGSKPVISKQFLSYGALRITMWVRIGVVHISFFDVAIKLTNFDIVTTHSGRKFIIAYPWNLFFLKNEAVPERDSACHHQQMGTVSWSTQTFSSLFLSKYAAFWPHLPEHPEQG